MDANTSGEELLAKARKPYTITKQRERWTEDEHDRFLDALRLYGRAWQRIEEHIGTKTAVQIRSHAQKFFTKLEKEAQAKGIPVCQALDIEIPPPRPKRKPTTPYPRKPGNGASSSHVSSAKDTKLVSSASSSRCTQAFLDLEKPPFSEKPNGREKTSSGKENQDDNCSGISTRPHEAHCSSITSVNKYPLPKKVTPGNPSTFMESEQYLRKASADNGTNNAVQDIAKTNKDRDGDGVNGPPHSMQNYPSHVPMDVVNGSMAKCSQNPPGMVSQDFMFHPMGEVHGHSGSLTNQATSSATTSQHQDNVLRSFHQAFPAFHPAFTPACHTQDDYRSFLQMSTTFSNLILSTLLQNPAAHAAATFAASCWPYPNVGSSGDSSTSTNQTDGTFPPRQMNSPPSIAAIAAATVAAATAWWAAHGLLPVCAPLTCVPIPTTAVPPPESGQTTMTETGKNDTTTTIENAQQLVGKESTAQQDQNLASKSPASSSDDSEETGITKLNTDSKTNDEKEEVVVVHDSNTTEKKRPVDRSSCGSNTPSGSDAETDALEKVEKDKEDEKEIDTNQPAIELSNRRTKIRDNNNPLTDSWKEVSEGGRLAFQALFARERLPQSFSPPQDAEKEKQNQNDMSMSLPPNNNNQDSEVNGDQERLVMICNGPGKSLKSRQTGFKPYKRCSMEVKESQVGNTNNQNDEKVCKRIRLEGEAST